MADPTENSLASGVAGVSAIASTIVHIMVEKGIVTPDEASLRFHMLAKNLSAQLSSPLGAQLALQVAQSVEVLRRDRQPAMD